MSKKITVVIAAGVTILNLIDGINAKSIDTVTVEFDDQHSAAQIAEALVGAGRGELVEQITGVDEDGTEFKFSPVNAQRLVHIPSSEEAEEMKPGTPNRQGETDDEKIKREKAEAENDDDEAGEIATHAQVLENLRSRSVAGLKAICEQIGLEVPENVGPEDLTELILANVATREVVEAQDASQQIQEPQTPGETDEEKANREKAEAEAAARQETQETEAARVKALKKELKDKTVVELREMCKTMDIKIPRNSDEAAIINLIVGAGAPNQDGQ